MKQAAMIALAAAALAGGACKKRNAADESGGTGAATATGQPKAPPPEPFSGKLSIDRVLGSRDLVKPFDPWDDGLARLQALMGTPTKVEGARHTWAVVEGDDCAYVYVTKDNGAD